MSTKEILWTVISYLCYGLETKLGVVFQLEVGASYAAYNNSSISHTVDLG